MTVEPFAVEGIASAVHALSHAAWKTGSWLSKLDTGTQNADSMIKFQAADVRSLGNECDLVYAELEEVFGKRETEPLLPFDVNDRVWKCLATQVEESYRIIQELQLLMQSVKEADSSPVSQVQNQKKLEKSQDQIMNIKTKVRRQTDSLRNILLLIKM